MEQVGSGGMGQVYKALDGETNRTVALKLIRPDVLTRVGALTRFKRELALAQTVSHPNVYRVHDLGETDGLAFISMEYVDGSSLDESIRSMGHLSPRQTVSIGRQICAGLEAIHEKAIVHRDLKPSNIMVDRAGVARLMDFGLAYQTGSEHLTSEGQVLGTMAYLSPEQARGDVIGPPSDIYALGLILYEMLTGKRPPGDGKPIPLALRGAGENCPRPSHFVAEIPKAVDAVVMKCLERDPARRFASAEALADALDAIATGQTTKILLPLRRTTGPYSVARGRRWPWAVGVAAALLAALAAVPSVRTRALSAFSRGASGATANTQVVAILPFTAIRGGADEDLAVGIADMLATDLTDAACGSVLPRVDTAKLGGTSLDVRKVAGDLGLTRVVTGTVQPGAAETHVEVNVFAADGSLVSSLSDGGSDSLALQRRMADRLVASLCIGGGRSRNAKAPTASVPAFLAYSKGLRLLDRRDVKGNVTEAVQSLQTALELDPQFALAHATLGKAYWWRYNETRESPYTNKALIEISQALRLDSEQPRVRLIYAQVQRWLGNAGAAKAEIDKLLSERPNDLEARALSGELLAQTGELERGLSLLEKAIADQPKYFRHHAAVGYAQALHGDWAACRQAYGTATTLQPDYAEGFAMMGACAQSAGDDRAALSYYESAAALGEDATLYSNIGTLHYDAGRFEKAVVAYRRAVDLVPGEMLFRWNLGDALHRLGKVSEARARWSEAVAVGQDAIRTSGPNARLLSRIALCEAKLGRVEQALADAREATRLEPGTPEVLYQQGAVLALLGRPHDAIQSLALAIDKGFSRVRARRDYDLRSLRNEAAFTALVEDQSSGLRGGSK